METTDIETQTSDILQVIRIDPEGRYIICIEGIKMSVSALEHLNIRLRDWWDSDRKFCVLSIPRGSVKFVRMENVLSGEE